jgi:hypothetical protein
MSRLKTFVTVGGVARITDYETIKGRGVKDTFSNRSSNPVLARAAHSRLNREISELLISSVLEREVSRQPEGDQKVMVTAMKNAGKREAAQLVTFISRWLLNIQGTDSGIDAFRHTTPGMLPSVDVKGKRVYAKGGGRPVTGVVSWRGLRRGTLKSKKDKRFFRDEGHLAQAILSMKQSYPDSLGGVQVVGQDLTKNKKALAKKLSDVPDRIVLLKTIDVKIFPQANRSLFPGLLNGKWDAVDPSARLEQSGFFPTEISKKLRGPYMAEGGRSVLRFRPMFGPVTQFWMMHRIPMALAKAIADSSKARK